MRSKEQIFVEAFKDGSLERWARAGATDRQLAENLGMGKDSFYKYLKAYPDALDSIQRARKPVVTEAFEGLVRLSTGFHEKKISKHMRKIYGHDKKGNRIETGRIEEIYEDDVYYPPDHKAATKVIVNYLNYLKKNKDGGIPNEYINEPEITIETKQGRLPEMEQAMRELFYGDDNES